MFADFDPAQGQKIVDEPAQVNADPEGAAWFVKIKPSHRAEFDALMDEAAYKEFTESA